MSYTVPYPFTSGYRSVDGFGLDLQTRDPRWAASDGVVAAQGGGQLAATKLIAPRSRVTVVGNPLDSVILPPAKPGMMWGVYNADPANTLQVFPLVGERFFRQPVDQPVNVPAGSFARMMCFDWHVWVWFPLHTGTSPPPPPVMGYCVATGGGQGAPGGIEQQYEISGNAGIAWTDETNGAPKNIITSYCVCKIPAGFMYGGSGTTSAHGAIIQVSPDGINFTIAVDGAISPWTVNLGSWGQGNVFAVAYDHGIYMAGGVDENGVGHLEISLDPSMEWNDFNTSGFEVAGGGIHAIAYGNGIWVAAGFTNSTHAMVQFSTDNGNTWTTSATNFGALNPSIQLLGVAYGNGKFVAVGGTTAVTGNGFEIWTSPNGNNWTRQASRPFRDGNDALDCVAYDGTSRFLAGGAYAGASSGGAILSSPDGVTWTDQPGHHFGHTGRIQSLTWSGSDWVAGGYAAAVPSGSKGEMEYSVNGGVTWTGSTINTSFGLVNAVVCTPAPPPCYQLVLWDNLGNLWVSTDLGNDFTTYQVPTPYTPNDDWTDFQIATNDENYDSFCTFDQNVLQGQQGGLILGTLSGAANLPLAPVINYGPAAFGNHAGAAAGDNGAFSPTTGLILATVNSRNGGAPYHPRISRDGGATWADITALSSPNGWYGAAFSQNGTNMYVQEINGGHLWKSTDSGITWSMLSASPTFDSVTGVPESTPVTYRLRCSQNGQIVAIITASGAGPGCHFWISKNGGVTWNSTDLLALIPAPERGSGVGVFATDFGMTPDGMKFVAAFSGTNQAVGVQWGWLFKSTDGINWTQIFPPWLTVPDFVGHGFTCVNISQDGLCVFVGYNRNADLYYEADLSTDFGVSWAPTLNFGNGVAAGNLMNGLALPCVTSPPPPPLTPCQIANVLDGLAIQPTGAYSTRKLKAGYAGPALRVWRQSDGHQLDIGFGADCSLDNNALLTFCAGTNCNIATWYDQSGHGNDNVAFAGDFSNSHKIVTSGALAITVSGHTAVKSGTNFTTAGTAGVMLNPGQGSIFTVGNAASGGTPLNGISWQSLPSICGADSDFGGNGNMVGMAFAQTAAPPVTIVPSMVTYRFQGAAVFAFTDMHAEGSVTFGANASYAMRYNVADAPNVTKGYVNGGTPAVNTNTTLCDGPNVNFCIGRGGNQARNGEFVGMIAEVIVFSTELSISDSNKLGVNQSAYWGVPWTPITI